MSVWPSLCVYQPMHTHKSTPTWTRAHTHHTHTPLHTDEHTYRPHTPHMYTWTHTQTSYTQRHTSEHTQRHSHTTHTHTRILVKNTSVQVVTPSFSAPLPQQNNNQHEKKNWEQEWEAWKIKEKNTKLHFVKGAYDLRTMQPNRFETVYLRKEQKERLFVLGK